jgi:hypothetical protein
MKLIGSRAEQNMREELLRSNAALRNKSYGPLTLILASENVDVAAAYVVNWIHEQAEDIYAVIVPSRELLIIEIPRGAGQALVWREDLIAYKKKRSKLQRLKIAVAEDLLESSGRR